MNKQRAAAGTPSRERVPSDAVRRLLVGLTPIDSMPPPVIRELGIGPRNPNAGRDLIVAAYLDAYPEAGRSLEAALTAISKRTDGRRDQYQELAAETRAALVSRAELHHAAVLAPEATEDVLQGLEAYLSQGSERPTPPK
jgi:hypothetical protein